MKEASVIENRDRFIGGSDIPIMMNISPFKTRWQLLLEKAEPEKYYEPLLTTPEIEYGNTMEPVIRDYVNSFMGKEYQPGVIVKDDLRGNMDGYDGDTVLEIKTTSQIHTNVDEYKYYIVQLLFYMQLTGATEGYLAVYERPKDLETTFDGNRLQVWLIKYEDYENWLEQINFQIDRFRNDLAKVKENPLLTEEDLQPNSVIKAANWVLALDEQCAFYKKLEEEHKQAKAELKAAMEMYRIKKWITNGGTKITLVPDGEDKIIQEFDEKAFKEDHPDLWEYYVHNKTKKGRTGYVVITPPKEG